MKNTREEILRAVYADMQINGFQGTRPDKVIRELGITKGALYHYFPGKLALGYAIVDEIIAPTYLGYWRELENYAGNPVDFLLHMVQSISNACSQKRMLIGSPLSNLIQEMSPLDEGFRQRLRRIVEQIYGMLAEALEKGQRQGQVRADLNPQHTAGFILAALEGCYTTAKAFMDAEMFTSSLASLIRYLNTLKTNNPT